VALVSLQGDMAPLVDGRVRGRWPVVEVLSQP
jgi:hypothetical protein